MKIPLTINPVLIIVQKNHTIGEKQRNPRSHYRLIKSFNPINLRFFIIKIQHAPLIIRIAMIVLL